MSEAATQRVALLIQGAPQSTGRTGSDPLSSGRMHEFDAVANTRRLIETARDAGYGPIVLSVWQNDPRLVEAERLPNVDRLLPLPDPLPCPAYALQGHVDNRIRQAFGCRAGMRAVVELGPTEYAVRIRTDQSLDLRGLKEFVVSQSTDSLYVPAIHRTRLAHLIDFFVAGTAARVLEHYEALGACDFHAFHPSSHLDYFFKEAFERLRDRIDPRAFFPQTYYYLDSQLPIFRFMAENHLRPLPDAVARSVVWRGSPFTDDYLRSRWITHEEWEGGKRAERLNGLPTQGLRLTDWTAPHLVDVPRMNRALKTEYPEASPTGRTAARWMTLWERLRRGSARW